MKVRDELILIATSGLIDLFSVFAPGSLYMPAILISLVILIGCTLLRSFAAVLYSILYILACSKTIDVVLYLMEKFAVRKAG